MYVPEGGALPEGMGLLSLRFSLLFSQGTERFRTPAGARVTSLCWPKEK
jgi:hypothetical protein